MSKNELFKEIMKELKSTAKKIKAQEKGKTLENPIDIDIVKSLKANFYESALEHYKKYKLAREDE